MRSSGGNKMLFLTLAKLVFIARGTGSIDDRIGGYRLWDIERFSLSFILNHDHLRLVLKGNKPTGVTNANIDLLINQYN